MLKFNNKQKVFIVAEISANHCQDFNKAVALIKKAKAAGADAVKFQTYRPDCWYCFYRSTPKGNTRP